MQTAFEETSGKDLKAFFDFWFRGTKIPEYFTNWHYSKTDQGYEVTIKIQSNYAFHAIMPIEILTTTGANKRESYSTTQKQK